MRTPIHRAERAIIDHRAERAIIDHRAQGMIISSLDIAHLPIHPHQPHHVFLREEVLSLFAR